MKVLSLFAFLVLATLGPYVTAVMHREYRTLLPYTLDEFHEGYAWSTAESSLYETGGGEGIEIEALPHHCKIGSGQCTTRILHIASKMPKFIRLLAPHGSLEIHEESWTYPNGVKSVYSNRYMKDAFHVTVTSKYLDDDDCQKDDVFPVHHTLLDRTIMDLTVEVGREDEQWNPADCESKKLNLAPLTSGWMEKRPRMCIYTLVEVEFKWFGMQQTVEQRIIKAYPILAKRLHRQMFCWADKWAGLSMDQVREKEAIVKEELDLLRRGDKVRGVKLTR